MKRLLSRADVLLISAPFTLSIVFISLLYLFPGEAYCQVRAESTDRPDTLALVKGRPITSGDFLTRFEMSLYPGKDDPTRLEKTKRGFLYSMIAEKLLAQAADHSDMPYTSSEEILKREMEDIFMRDALFRKEIVPQATVSNDELLHGFDISVYKYMVDAFYFDADSAKAREFYAAAIAGKRSDIYEIAGKMNVRHDTLDIPYGESSAKIENAFFGHRKGFVSKPTVTVDGLVVFRVLGRELNQKFISGSTPDRLYRIKQILVTRKQTRLGNDYIESVMKGIDVSVNSEVFRPLVYAIRTIFEKQKPPSYDPYYRLSPADLVELGREFYSELNEPLLSFEGGSLSLEQVFQQLPTAMFASDDATLPGITYALHGSLRFISQNYFLVQRAKELGLQNSWEVKHNVEMVMDAFQAYRMANQIMDTVSVTQPEVDSYFSSHHDEVLNAVKLRLRIYRANNINQAIDIYTRLDREKETPVAPEDTSAHWVDAYNLGEIGAVLSQLKKGSIYGPVEEKGEFFLYQVLDERSSVNDAAIRNSIDVARQMLLDEERRKTLDRYVAGLAENDNVKIFRENVLSLKVTPFQMLTYRLIGFGGRILAVPSLYPREGWIRYFNQNKRPPLP